MTVHPVAAEKVCTKCGELKNLSEFSARKQAADGLTSACKTCTRESNLLSKEDRRKAIGDEAYKAAARASVEKSRAKPEVMEKQREYNRAVQRALSVLREEHRPEYEHYLLLAIRGELPAPKRRVRAASQEDSR